MVIVASGITYNTNSVTLALIILNIDNVVPLPHHTHTHVAQKNLLGKK